MAIFMKYGSIDGDSEKKGFEKWIAIDSFQFGVGRGIANAAAGASKREASVPSVSEIVITKSMDVSSPLLLKESLQGPGTQVKIQLTRTDAKGEIAFQKYILEDCMVSSYSVSSGGDRPSESLSLNFGKITSEYMKIDSKFGMATTGPIIWDLTKSERT